MVNYINTCSRLIHFSVKITQTECLSKKQSIVSQLLSHLLPNDPFKVLDMPIILVFLFLVATAQSQLDENLILEDSITEYEEYTAEDVLCNDLNVSISFSNLNLYQINENFLSSPLITCLDLNRNSINKIYPKAFDNLPNLKYLDLSNNEFDLSIVMRDNFLELETLILNNCHSSYGWRIEGFYPKLKKLFLERSKIHSIKSTDMDNLPSLTHLYLSNNNIEQADFKWLPESIQYLDLSGNSLRSLTLTNLTNLRKLFLDNQYSKRLYDIRFENLMSLKYLSARSNGMEEITDSTFKNAPSLTYLDISDSKIKRIRGDSFNSMKNLQFLNLSNNYLETIQIGTFDQLKNLNTLILEKNLIGMFPMVASEINVRSLLLNCNKLRSIVGGTFSKMPFLESLFLHDNELSYLDQEAFRGLKNLKTLTLSNNQLSLLPVNWMLPLTSLTVLDLIGNSIRNFSDLSLSESSSLKNLYLSKQLEYINAQALFSIPDNVTIDLREDTFFVKQCNKRNNKYDQSYYG